MVVAACGSDRLVETGGALSAQPSALDFKNVPVGLSVTLKVKLTNTTARAVSVTSVDFGTPEFSSPQKAFTVPAADSVDALVAFAPQKLGEFSGAAVFKSALGPVTVSVRGVGVVANICAPCGTVPASTCASGQTLITYTPAGTCIESGCAFEPHSVECAVACDAVAHACAPSDAGPSDAGQGADAGTGSPDAGSPDAGSPADAGPGGGGTPPDAAVTPDAGFDAGVVDTGPHGHADWFDGGEYTWDPPAGVTHAHFYGCGAGGAGGSVPGATGGGAACGRSDIQRDSGRPVRVRVGRGGQEPGNGGGYTALFFSGSGNLEDYILGGGGGGGNGCAGCTGHFGGKGGAGGDGQGKDGEVYFGTGQVCSTARGGLGGRPWGGPIDGAGGLGGEVPGGSGGVRCAGGFGSRLSGGTSKTLTDGVTCALNGGAFLWNEGGSEAGAGGSGGAGAFGGGGGGFVKGLCGGGGGGGSSVLFGATSRVYEGDGRNPGFASFGRMGAGLGGEEALDPTSNYKGADGYVLITW